MELKTAKGVPETENSERYHQLMVDAMGLSFFKYGPVADAYPSKVDAIASLKKRLERYEETGNTEWLVDVGNFAMIEFMHPKHPQAHFAATDSKDSPGRKWNSGHEGQTANTAARENVRLGGSNRTTSGGFYKSEGD